MLINLGLALLGQGKNSAAAEILGEAVALNPKETTALLALGNARVLNGQFGEAAEAFEQELADTCQCPGVTAVEFHLAR